MRDGWQQIELNINWLFVKDAMTKVSSTINLWERDK